MEQVALGILTMPSFSFASWVGRRVSQSTRCRAAVVGALGLTYFSWGKLAGEQAWSLVSAAWGQCSPGPPSIRLGWGRIELLEGTNGVGPKDGHEQLGLLEEVWGLSTCYAQWLLSPTWTFSQDWTHSWFPAIKSAHKVNGERVLDGAGWVFTEVRAEMLESSSIDSEEGSCAHLCVCMCKCVGSHICVCTQAHKSVCVQEHVSFCV